jgi:hypothetical protein
MTKRRIIRKDSFNWAIQCWQTGGDVVERGKYAGQEKKSKWLPPEAFYNKLADAAKDMLHETIGDVPTGEVNLTGEQLVIAIQNAEKRTQTYLTGLLSVLATDTLIGVLQERGYTVTDGKKGRKSYVEDDEDADPA